MAKAIDLTNQRFGILTVLKRDFSRKSDTYWFCQCECGNITSVLGKNLRKGRTKSCGCQRNTSISNSLRQDITGQKFGRLTVLAYDEKLSKQKGGSYWRCQCDCGNNKSFLKSNLITGKTSSCGCYNRDAVRARCLKDLTGQHFGNLTVIEFDEDLSNVRGHTYWKCQCICGNIKSVLSSALIQKHTTSCGCLRTSVGEHNIAQILETNQIPYIKEYQIKELGKLRYDFYLPNMNRLIEFDGVQHFENNPASKWNQNGKFEKRQENDGIKTEYAIKHNYELVRIPYWERDYITLEMLIGDQYLITR